MNATIYTSKMEGTGFIQFSPAVSTRFFFRIDIGNNQVHILDIMGDEPCRSVTNSAEEVVDAICNQFRFHAAKWEWILYGTDCVVSKFYRPEGQFTDCNESDWDTDMHNRMVELYGNK